MRVGTVGTVQITPPLPRFGFVYAAKQKASFLRAFLHLEVGAPTVPFRRLLSTQRGHAGITNDGMICGALLRYGLFGVESWGSSVSTVISSISAGGSGTRSGSLSGPAMMAGMSSLATG